MTTKPTAPDLIAEIEELLAKYQRGRRSVIMERDAFALLRRLVEEVKRLRDRDSTCVVCSALLLTSSEPPHCVDCHVTDDIRDDWEAQP